MQGQGCASAWVRVRLPVYRKGKVQRGDSCQQSPRLRDVLEEGEGPPPPPPSRAPSLRPSTVSLTPSASFNGICNRQQPPPTALATSSNRLSNRLWGRL